MTIFALFLIGIAAVVLIGGFVFLFSNSDHNDKHKID